MTSPARGIDVVCPRCGRPFTGYYRPSINLGLGEKWTDEEIEEATTIRCAGCDLRMAPDTLIVDQDGTFQIKKNMTTNLKKNS